MATALKNYGLYIGGEWVDATSDDALEVINPATEEAIGAVPQASIRVEPGLQSPARGGAVGHRHGPRRVRRRPLDTHLDQRPVRRAADAKVSQLEPPLLHTDSKRLDEALGEHKKKRGPHFARFTDGGI